MKTIEQSSTVGLRVVAYAKIAVQFRNFVALF
jgi:hypothetical protein